MILVDECCGTHFAEYLKEKGLKEVIDVQGNEAIKGLKDEHLQDYLRDYNGILITKDLLFYTHYDGKKVYHDEDNWNETYKKLTRLDNNTFEWNYQHKNK